jgi:hypothetical protein
MATETDWRHNVRMQDPSAAAQPLRNLHILFTEIEKEFVNLLRDNGSLREQVTEIMKHMQEKSQRADRGFKWETESGLSGEVSLQQPLDVDLNRHEVLKVAGIPGADSGERAMPPGSTQAKSDSHACEWCTFTGSFDKVVRHEASCKLKPRQDIEASSSPPMGLHVLQLQSPPSSMKKAEEFNALGLAGTCPDGSHRSTPGAWRAQPLDVDLNGQRAQRQDIEANVLSMSSFSASPKLSPSSPAGSPVTSSASGGRTVSAGANKITALRRAYSATSILLRNHVSSSSHDTVPRPSTEEAASKEEAAGAAMQAHHKQGIRDKIRTRGRKFVSSAVQSSVAVTRMLRPNLDTVEYVVRKNLRGHTDGIWDIAVCPWDNAVYLIEPL